MKTKRLSDKTSSIVSCIKFITELTNTHDVCTGVCCDKLTKNPDKGHVAALARSHMNGLLPFEGTIEQTTETIPPSHKTITAATMIKQ